jgi:stage V sporulation protein R
MAHCVGHSDFFKNNRMFKDTRPDSVVGRFRSAKKRIKTYIEDPTIGIEEVERVLDAAHALQFQNYRYGQNRIPPEILLEKYQRLIQEDQTDEFVFFDINKVPLEPDYDILAFIAEHGAKMPFWKRDIIEIVRDEAAYFRPQIQTKIMNEGWASYWHYTIMHELNLPASWHLPFIKTHNQVIRPHIGGLNPYHLGFVMFKHIFDNFGAEEALIARETAHDVSFLRQYLTEELCAELGLFSFSEKRKEGFTIDDISDEEGWKEVKNKLLANVGTNALPVIYVEEVEEDGTLVVRHEHDGRDLELDEAEKVIKHARRLWGNNVKLFTELEEELWEI